MRRIQRVAENVTEQKRAGYALVFFAMLLLGIMAMAALVIDIGFARLTQRQMKQATDAAALEAIRKSDVETATSHVYAGRTAATDIGRRQAAADLVTALFDDDFDDSDDARSFGAGPAVDLSGGIELNDGFFASQQMSAPATPVYKPQLQLNTGDASDGDIVSAGTELTVRLQRNSSGGVAGVSSNGGTVPYLFGRGSLLASELKATGIGLTVTSTAEMHPVVRIGVRQRFGEVVVAGGIPFAVSRLVWEGLPVNLPTSVPLTIGSCGATSVVLTEIGQAAVLLPTPLMADGYVAVADSIGGTDRVIGFGWALIRPDPGNPANVQIAKHRDAEVSQTVAPENATARLSEAWTSLSELSDADRQTVIDANRSLTDPLVSPILNPEE